MTKAFRALIVGLLLSGVLAACGGTTETGGATTGASGAASTVASTAASIASTGASTAASSAAASEAASGDAMSSMAASTDAMASSGGMMETATAGSGGTGAPVSGQLTIAGSSALLPLIQEAANKFQQANSGAQLTVTAGGSGAGRTQVCEGKIDIGNSDVALSDKEKTEKNCADAQQFQVAIQAFAPVANKTGPGSVTNLTKDQLVSIFTGQVTNWKDVGGTDQEIVLVNRAKGSGTRSNMAKFLFDGDDNKFATGASEEDNSETVRQTVAQTPGAISYLGFAYLNNPDIVTMSVDGVAPNVQDIQSGAWKIGGPGYMITKGEPSEIEKAFIDYVTGTEFQTSESFSKLGFVPVKK